MRLERNKTNPGEEGTKVLIASLDIDYNFTAFNKEYKTEFKKLFNIDLTIGASVSDILKDYPAERQIIIDGGNKAIYEDHFSEIREFDIHGIRKTFEFSFSSLWNENQKVGITHIIRDISERINAEKVLKEREERVHLLSRSTNDAIYEWNLSNGKFWWNDGMYNLFGYSIKEVDHTKEWWLDKIHNLDRPSLMKSINENIRNEISFWTHEYRFQKANGSYAIVIDRGYVMYNGAWEPVRIIGAITDITEKKRVEDALIKREAQFSSLLQNSSDIISILNTAGRYTYISPSIKEILGYTSVELLGKTRNSLIHADDLPLVESTLRKITNTSNLITIQNRFLHKEGHYVILESTYNNLLEDPAVDGIVINSRDITDRMAVQNALKKSEAFLKESQRIAKMGSWEFDLITQQLSWSDELFYVLQRNVKNGPLSAEEIQSELLPESWDLLTESLTKAIEKGEGFNLDCGRMINGNIQYLNNICSPIKDKSGKTVKLQGIVIDITARKETEEKLLESEEWFKTIFNTSRDGFVVELNEKVFYVNDALVKLFGYKSQKEILGDPITSLIADDNMKIISEYSQKRLKGEEIPNIYETKGKRKDGEVIDVEISASVFSIRGNKYIIASVRDITERKQAEKQLMEQNEELKKINSELDRFVYSASHDLRAPLVSVLGLTNLLKINESDLEKIKYLDLVTKSIHKLDRFIQEIIHHSRNSRVEVKYEAIDFRKIIEDTFEDLRYLDEAKNIQTSIEITGNEPFYSDASRLSVIFNNLISNAIRYSYPDIRPPSVDIAITITCEKVKIRISDNGQGIEQGHVKRIFEMFYRASTKNVGSGLGLYIVKESIIKLGGSIEVYSTFGEGTTFEITLPNSPESNNSF
ncbi:MAG TPA: PAS domain S-box protein [Cytophagales bacterium]|nr:PAS domain S-box protein [Cytophagales bacterium]